MTSALLLLSILSLASPGAASATWVYDYELASPLSTPWIKTNVALCDDPEDTCLGGAIFPIRDRNVVAGISDDITGTDAPMLLCVWHPEGSGACTGEDAVSPTGCGPQVIIDVPFVPERGVVYTYTFHIDERLDICMATRGSFQIHTF